MSAPHESDEQPSQRQPLPSAAAVAAYLGVPVTTLYQWRHKQRGPRATKVGRHLRYAWSDVDAWLAGRATSTSDTTQCTCGAEW